MLHKHAATIRPYPPPTRQHAAARPNSRQIRQMSAMPANPPFQSQFAARPNNRRHRHPTATHPQTTSTPNLSQTLVISRQTLVISRTALIRAPASSRRPSHPENSKILQILLQTIRPTQITAHPPKSQKSQFRQRSNTRPATREFASPLPSRKSQNPANPASDNPPNRNHSPSPKIPKITVQTTVKHSPGHPRVRSAPPIPKIPPNPKNHSSDNPPNASPQPIPNIP